MKDVKKIKNAYVSTSLISFVLGLFLVLKPATSGHIISYILGACFIFYGIVHIVTYIIAKNENFYQYDLAKGIITVSIGIFFILRPSFIISILPTLLGFAILVNGIFGIQSSINMLRATSKGWLAVFIPAIITIILGMLIVINPFEWAKMLLVIIGGCLIWNGVSNFWTHICISRKFKEVQSKTQPIDTTADESNDINEDK